MGVFKHQSLERARDFFTRVLDWGRLNFKVITSIPELEDATTIKWYTPSCLSKVSFTIVIKLLANRSGDIANRIIDDCQSALLKEEIFQVKSLLYRRWFMGFVVPKSKVVIFRSDFEKSYDQTH